MIRRNVTVSVRTIDEKIVEYETWTYYSHQKIAQELQLCRPDDYITIGDCTFKVGSILNVRPR